MRAKHTIFHSNWIGEWNQKDSFSTNGQDVESSNKSLLEGFQANIK